MKTTSRLFLRCLAVSLIVLAGRQAAAVVPESETKLAPANPVAFQNFGFAVAIDADTAVVGAPFDSTVDVNAGAAYVFVRDGDVWFEQAKLTANDPGFSAEFGIAVAISGDTIVVGAHLDPADASQAGAAYIFVRNGTTWIQQARLTPSDPTAGKQFGEAVAIDADTVAVSAIGDDDGGVDAGAIYVFTRSGDSWIQQAKLLSNDPRPGNALGVSLGLDGGTLVAGSPFDEDVGMVDSGALYVFVRSGTVWSQEAELRADDGAAHDLLGSSIALGGDTIVAGAPQNGGTGAAYVFARNAGLWRLQAKLTGDDAAPGDQFGFSVGLDGNTAVVGSLFDSSFVVNGLPVEFGGSAYVFRRSGTTWTQNAEVSAGDLASLDEFGFSVAVSGTTFVVGAPLKTDADEGAAYAFVLAANSAPVANSQSITTDEDTSKPVTLTASDAENDPLTYTVLGNPVRGTLSGTPPNLIYTPNPNENGADSFTFRVNDGFQDSEVATVAITITPVNDAPVALDQSLITVEDTPVAVELAAADVEGDALVFTVLTGPSRGTLSGTPPRLIYVPNPNENGPDSFTFKASDGLLDSTPATVAIIVTSVNDVPVPNEPVATPSVINENESTTVSGLLADVDPQDAHVVTISWGDGSPGTVLNLAPGVLTYSATHQYLDDQPTATASDLNTVTVTVDDGEGGTASATTTVTVNNVAPVIANLSGPTAPLALGSSASVSVDFSDVGSLDTHTVHFSWNDGTPDTEVSDGGFSRGANHVYNAPGVYAVGVTVIDDDTGAASTTFEFVVIYDPNDGFVTGGGWINSPAGAYPVNPSLTGKASFGFVSKYRKDSVPTGETEFQLKLAKFNFHSTAYEWLVIAGPMAQYKGSGTVNGAGSYSFLVTATDGDIMGGIGADKFRIQIWDNATGTVVYDNAFGASVELGAANPQPIGGGSIVVHKAR